MAVPPVLAVTGATGKLGHAAARALLEEAPEARIVAAVRDPSRAADLAARGIEVREADYDRPETLATAFEGVDRLLFVSSNALGARLAQHRAVIAAAREADIGFLAYTSMLRADRSPALLMAEHRETEAMIAAAGLSAAILRNGWYSENLLAGLDSALAHGVILGAARDGRFSAAAIPDYARAAARLLAAPAPVARAYELAGDDAFTMAAFAATLSALAGRTIAYVDVGVAELEQRLAEAGMPAPVAHVIADADGAAAQGALFESSGTLGAILGRPTTPIATTIAAALALRR